MPARGVFTNWLEALLAYAVIALLIVTAVFGYELHSFSHDLSRARRSQAEGSQVNRLTGIENRAVVCHILTGLGFSPDGFKASSPCLEPDVLNFYDPKAPESSRTFAATARTLTVECALAARLAVNVPECAQAP